MTRALLALLLVAGCARPAPFQDAVNGPVRIVVGDIAHLCLALVGTPVRGCLTRHPDGRVTIYCPRDDLACLAHEVRHAVDAGWTHP